MFWLKIIFSESNVMDYKMLVRKYMEHVITCAGTAYVDVLNDPMGSDVEFSDEENEELNKISIEATER